jgi:hypothetical protein
MLDNLNKRRDGVRKHHLSKMRLGIAASAFGFAAFASMPCAAAGASAVGQISEVAVSGGPDTANPGLTCIKLDVAVAPTCNGYIAIPNNNSKLVNAALMAKMLDRPMGVFYDVEASTTPQLHCPYLVFTSCSAITIIVK